MTYHSIQKNMSLAAFLAYFGIQKNLSLAIFLTYFGIYKTCHWQLLTNVWY